MPTTPIAPRQSPAAPSADRGAFVAGPHTLRERLEYLVAEARHILAAPQNFTMEEQSWARDMVATAAVHRERANGGHA
jgi:hypothetical protein